MNARTRKLIGMMILLLGLAGYTLAGVYVAITYIPEHWLVRLGYYIFAGLAWAYPARALLTWMHRPLAQTAAHPSKRPN